MTNLKKYKDDIINEIKTSTIKNLCCNIKDIQMEGKDFDCTGRDHESCDECAIKMIKWLGEETEEVEHKLDKVEDDYSNITIINHGTLNLKL